MIRNRVVTLVRNTLVTLNRNQVVSLGGISKGASVTGQMLRMDETINFEDPDHVIKEQHFILADGSGKSWLAHRYEYRMRE